MDEIIPYNPSDKALKELKKSGLYRSEKKKTLALEQERILLVFVSKSARFEQRHPVIATMTKTGMRIGEICGLT